MMSPTSLRAPRSIEECYNTDDYRALARRRLPPMIFDFLDGGSDDELSLKRNRAAFSDYEFLPRALTDITTVDTSTRLFGRDIAMPLMISPTGMSRMFHHSAEGAVARVAGREGIPYALSTMGTTTIEDIVPETSGPRVFQIYVMKDRAVTEDFIARTKASNYDGLILTVDTVITGNRERDRRHALSLPPKITPGNFLGFATRPGWSLPALRKNPLDLVNLKASVKEELPGRYSLFEFGARQTDRSLCWKDVEWIASRWGGPLSIKGIVTPEDAVRAHDHGATSVMLSNHGGRQLDGCVAPITQVASVARAVGGRMEIIVDGGVRRGADIVRALALGASACSIGRPYLYGLAAGGEAGVARVVATMREELERTLGLLGVTSLDQLNPDILRHAGQLQQL